jgi:hypothetical protein
LKWKPEVANIKSQIGELNKDLFVIRTQGKENSCGRSSFNGCNSFDLCLAIFLVAKPVLDIGDPKDFFYVVPITAVVRNVEFSNNHCRIDHG